VRYLLNDDWSSQSLVLAELPLGFGPFRNGFGCKCLHAPYPQCHNATIRLSIGFWIDLRSLVVGLHSGYLESDECGILLNLNPPMTLMVASDPTPLATHLRC
jgi:hypothetical protein